MATADETKQLLSDYRTKGDTAARDQLLDNYVPLVKRVCSRFRGSQEPQDDLIQVGMIGLLNAVEKFDPDTTVNPHADKDDPTYVGYDALLGVSSAFENGMPLNKPPYAFLVAVDLSTGDIAWRVPFGRGSDTLRQHPALAGVELPERLGTPGAPGGIVTQGGLVFVGGGEDALYAFNKHTGEELWFGELTQRSTATPMSYRSSGGRQFVVIATGSGTSQELVAFAIPD